MLPKGCEKKIREFTSGPNLQEGYVTLFEAVAKEAEMKDLPASTLVVPFYDGTEGLEPGDYAAELHFVVRKVDE